MTEEKNFKLIDGTFTVEEADTLLNRLFNYKIDFHTREDFSNHIRFNKNPKHSQTRITELHTSKEEIIKMIAELKDKNVNLVINSTITVSIE